MTGEAFRGFFLVDSKFNVVHVNDALARALGLGAGLRPHRLTLERLLKMLGCPLTSRQMASELRRHAGKSVHWQAQPFAEGQVWHVCLEHVHVKDKIVLVGVIHPEADKALTEGGAGLGDGVVQWAVESLREGFFVLEVRSRIIVYANEAFHSKRGLKPPLAVGKACYQVVRGLERPCSSYGRICPLESLGPEGQIAYCPNGDGSLNGSALVRWTPLRHEGEGAYVAGLEWSGTGKTAFEPPGQGNQRAYEVVRIGKAPSYSRLQEVVAEAMRAPTVNALMEVIVRSLRHDVGQLDIVLTIPDASGKGHLVFSEAADISSQSLHQLKDALSDGTLTRRVSDLLDKTTSGGQVQAVGTELQEMLRRWASPKNVLGFGVLGAHQRASGYYLLLSDELKSLGQDLRCYIDALLTMTAGALKRLVVEETAVASPSFQDAALVSRDGIIGRSKEMLEVYELIDLVAASDATVLITGENGTGKELVAQAIHNRSHRKKGPFVVAHCSAYSPTLLESELFGHEKGAFTGAIRRKMGRIERAQGGTLFLDEIGDIAPATQVLLLRFLQDHRFERVGGESTLQADVRVLAATNRNLMEEVENGRFRDDLYYRLNVISIHLPPLRDRKEDIPLLCHYFLKKYSAKEGKPVTSFSSGALQALMDYDWPGNVRQLENAVSHAVILAQEDTIRRQHLPRFLFQSQDPAPAVSLSEHEKRLILQVLRQTQWNKHEAAKKLQVSRSTLYSKIQRYGLRPEGAV